MDREEVWRRDGRGGGYGSKRKAYELDHGGGPGGVIERDAMECDRIRTCFRDLGWVRYLNGAAGLKWLMNVRGG